MGIDGRAGMCTKLGSSMKSIRRAFEGTGRNIEARMIECEDSRRMLDTA